MIYVAEILEQRFVKVGFTSSEDSEKRMCMLQTGSPYKINCIVLVDGTLRQEQALHQALTCTFARIRIPMPPNEWYPGRNPVMQEFISTIRDYGVNSALMFLDKYNQTNKQPGKGKTSLEPVMKWPNEVKKKFGSEEP